MSPPFGNTIGARFDEDVISSLFSRQNGCIKCDDVAPVCPPCGPTEKCSFTIPLTCKDCPTAYCAPDPTKVNPSTGQPAGSTTAAPSSGGTNTGAIIGGVVGGLAATAIITYLVWRFCIKTKRAAEYEADQWAEGARSKEGFSDNDAAAARQSKRASTHTVHSIASTVLTRASNIIQIAYIPGVTNRAAPNSPALLVPPVPPIPLAHAQNAGGGDGSPYDEQHFFTPGDLRNSTYSGISAFSDRTSYARTSYAPRSSVASTIYGKNAVVSPMPAQKGNFLKPSLVSVKSRGTGSDSGDSVPAVPSVDYEKYDKPPPSPAFSIGSAFFKNASTSTAKTVRPQMISLGSGGPKTIEIKSKASSTTISTIPETESNEKTGKSGVTITKTSPDASPKMSPTTPDQGPFADPPSESASTGLASVEEQDERPSSRPTSRQAAKDAERGRSPFGDEHAVKDN